jgi:hypothetical protein
VTDDRSHAILAAVIASGTHVIALLGDDEVEHREVGPDDAPAHRLPLALALTTKRQIIIIIVIIIVIISASALLNEGLLAI